LTALRIAAQGNSRGPAGPAAAAHRAVPAAKTAITLTVAFVAGWQLVHPALPLGMLGGLLVGLVVWRLRWPGAFTIFVIRPRVCGSRSAWMSLPPGLFGARDDPNDEPLYLHYPGTPADRAGLARLNDRERTEGERRQTWANDSSPIHRLPVC
jgi:hypothetical protein